MGCNHWAMWASGFKTADVSSPRATGQTELARGLAQAGETHHLPRLIVARWSWNGLPGGVLPRFGAAVDMLLAAGNALSNPSTDFAF
ncbi:unnamed protein product [Prunus armeniaca]